jgi:hypothetical protein
MNNHKVTSKYIKEIENKANSIPVGVLLACKNILDYLCESVFETDYYTYDILLEASKLKNENLLKEVIFYLTDSDINVLVYKFEIYDEASEAMIFVDTARIFRFYISKNFCHPLYGHELTFEEFNNEVIPFFSTSESFKSYFKIGGK